MSIEESKSIISLVVPLIAHKAARRFVLWVGGFLAFVTVCTTLWAYNIVVVHGYEAMTYALKNAPVVIENLNTQSENQSNLFGFVANMSVVLDTDYKFGPVPVYRAPIPIPVK